MRRDTRDERWNGGMRGQVSIAFVGMFDTWILRDVCWTGLVHQSRTIYVSLRDECNKYRNESSAWRG